MTTRLHTLVGKGDAQLGVMNLGNRLHPRLYIYRSVRSLLTLHYAACYYPRSSYRTATDPPSSNSRKGFPWISPPCPFSTQIRRYLQRTKGLQIKLRSIDRYLRIWQPEMVVCSRWIFKNDCYFSGTKTVRDQETQRASNFNSVFVPPRMHPCNIYVPNTVPAFSREPLKMQ